MKQDLIKGIQEALDIRLSQEKISKVLSVLPYVAKELAVENGEFVYTNFFKIVCEDREAKTFKNPATGEKIDKEACKVFRVKKSKSLFKNF